MLTGLRTRRCRKYALRGMSVLAGYLPPVRLWVLRKLSKHLLREQVYACTAQAPTQTACCVAGWHLTATEDAELLNGNDAILVQY